MATFERKTSSLIARRTAKIPMARDGSTRQWELTECIEVSVAIGIDRFVLIHRAVGIPIAELVRCRCARMATFIFHGDVRRRPDQLLLPISFGLSSTGRMIVVRQNDGRRELLPPVVSRRRKRVLPQPYEKKRRNSRAAIFLAVVFPRFHCVENNDRPSARLVFFDSRSFHRRTLEFHGIALDFSSAPAHPSKDRT